MDQGVTRPEADAIASDLTRARQRGLSNLNLKRGDQNPVTLPALESLAYRYANVTDGDRIALIGGLLRDALDTYAEGRPSDSDFVRALYFDAEGRSPGPAGPGGLRDAARGREEEDRFRRMQRTQIRDFAHFLAVFVARSQAVGHGDDHGELVRTPPQRRARFVRAVLAHRGSITAIGIGLVLVLTSALLIVLAHRPRPSSPKALQPGSSGSHAAASASSRAVQFRFDTHGDPPFSVLVYPGPLATATDRQSDGVYPDGALVTATCIVNGRSITFTPNAGGPGITSDRWVRIDTGPTAPRFASLAFGELVPVIAQLVKCGPIN